jgi:hypothetical protein
MRNLFSERHSNRLKHTAAIGSGVAATLPMTLVMFPPFVRAARKVDIFRILGGLFTSVDSLAVFLGAGLHLGAGGLFGLSYAQLWQTGYGKASLKWGMIFGACHGVLASISMMFLLMAHPRRPQSWRLTNVVTYIAAHLVFGTLVAALYRPRR